MRQYNNKMYKAMLRFIVAKWVPYSLAMRLLTDWNNMLSQKNYSTIEMVSRIEMKAKLDGGRAQKERIKYSSMGT